MSDTALEDAPLAPGADQFPQQVDDGFNDVDDADDGATAEAEPESPVEAVDEEPEVEEVAETDAAPEDDGFGEVVTAAALYGWDADKVKTFGTPEAARFAMAELDRQAALWGKSQFAQPQEQQQPADRGDAGKQTQQSQQTQQAQQAQQALVEKYQTKAKAEDWEPEVLAEFNGLNDFWAEQFSKQRKDLEELRNATIGIHEHFQGFTRQQQAEQAERVTREADTYFDSLGPEAQAIYGKGSINSLDPNGAQFKARQELWVDAQGLMYADQAAGRPQQPLSNVLGRVFNARHADLIKQAARKEVEQKVKDRAKQSISRPAGKNGKALSGRDKAMAYAEEMSKHLR